VEDFQKLFGIELAGFLQVFHRNLHGKERIAQFVCETARQFAPRSNALGLHQALLLSRKRLGHFIEGLSKLANLITPMNIDARIPSSAGDFARAFSKFFDRLGNSCGNPEADEQSDEKRSGSHRAGDL